MQKYVCISLAIASCQRMLLYVHIIKYITYLNHYTNFHICQFWDHTQCRYACIRIGDMTSFFQFKEQRRMIKLQHRGHYEMNSEIEKSLVRSLEL